MATAMPVTSSVPGASTDPPAVSGPLLAAWAAYRAGFRGQSLLTAVAIAGAESGYHPDSLNNNPSTGDYSVGLWQINYYDGLAPGRTRQFGPPSALTGVNGAQANANAAFAISGGGRNFSPWTTYTSGAYQQHASEAAQAVNQVTGGDIGTGPVGGATDATLTAANTGGGKYHERCLIKAPGWTAPGNLFTIGSECLFGTGQARAVAGAGLVAAGAILGMAGMVILSVALLGKNLASVASFAPGPVGTVAKSVSASTPSTGPSRAPRREEPLTSQDKSDLDAQLSAKRPSPERDAYQRDRRARARASRPRARSVDRDLANEEAF